MNDHHTITGKMCRDATKSHPYTSRHPGNCIEVIQSKAIQKCNYTRSTQCVIKLFTGYFWLINRREVQHILLVVT